MLPPKRRTKRRHSASRWEESSKHQRSSAAGRLRKRSRLGKSSKMLRGGKGEEYTSKFGWPYNPLLSDAQILDWIRQIGDPLKDCMKTRHGNNRDGLLGRREVAFLNADTNKTMNKLHFWKHDHVGNFNMFHELMYLLRYMNVFVVTNKTPDTSVRLNCKPLVDTTLKYNRPLILRPEDAFSNDPVCIRDWRPGSGGTEQNPSISEIFLRAEHFDRKKGKGFLNVIVTIEDERVFNFEVKWFGPHAFLPQNNRILMPTWLSYIKNQDGSEVPDSLLVPNRSSMQELMKKWMPHIRRLMETKRYGINRTLDDALVTPFYETAEANFRSFEEVANGAEATPLLLELFRLVMHRLRVVNLTEGSLVLMRTIYSSHAFRYNEPDVFALYPADIIAVEVHFPGRGKVYQITENIVNVERVEGSLEVTITLPDENFVALKLDWYGPTSKAPNGEPWEVFMGLKH